MHNRNFDVIVVGGGHAGTEAALISAKMGLNTLLLTQQIETLGQMSCNPAIGGIGKGHLVKEIDALGGIMGRAADYAGIQFRTLNERKGPAVQATRAQADRALYKEFIRKNLENQPNLTIFQQEVIDLVLKEGKVVGLKTQLDLTFYATSVVLTVGTFLGGKIHVGMNKSVGGRLGCSASIPLAHTLRALPFKVGRLKTGTPPRLDGRTVDFSKMEEQWGTNPTPHFSFWTPEVQHPQQICCHITYTTEKTLDIIRSNLSKSAMYAGEIEGIGPRYCPSIEDKIVRFSDKPRHQIFVEPEGLHTVELYPNGLSTSLPFEVQEAFIQSIVGFERAHITRPGYAIEYDYFNPEQLHPTLETKCVEGLFFAGQINGTTGYEEAASQGIIAGINAARRAQGKAGWYPTRQEAYIGVLIDDLITLGTTEPYRMFTSRAEHRLLLREDNADLRLSSVAIDLGTLSASQRVCFLEKSEAIERLKGQLAHLWVRPNTEQAKKLEELLPSPLEKEYHFLSLLKRPQLGIQDFRHEWEIPSHFNPLVRAGVLKQVETQVKYEGYIRHQEEEIEKQKSSEHILLGYHLDYNDVSGLSNEVREKLSRIRPDTIGMASRIPGITPAAISLLLIHLKKKEIC